VNLKTMPTDPATLRTLFASVPQSVVALCGLDPSGTPQGMTISSFTPISLDPPLVSVAMAETSTTWPKLRQLPRLGISLLSHSQGPTCRTLAAKTGDRFADLQWRSNDNTGAVFIDAAAAELECELFGELPAGDHSIVLLLIKSLSVDDRQEPLVFYGSDFRRLDS
jgi:flavin reductase (DIM6/NTAB) family NADH-FMN oxidoreductase RutF